MAGPWEKYQAAPAEPAPSPGPWAKYDTGFAGGLANRFKAGALATGAAGHQIAAEALQRGSQDIGKTPEQIYQDIKPVQQDPFVGEEIGTDIRPRAMPSLFPGSHGSDKARRQAEARAGRGERLAAAGETPETMAAKAQEQQMKAGGMMRQAGSLPRSQLDIRGEQAYRQAFQDKSLAPIVENPGAVGTHLLGVTAESAPPMAAGIGAGILTGSPAAAAATMGLVSGMRERFSEPFSLAQTYGIDPTTPEGAKQMMTPEFLAEAQRRGMKRGAIVGSLDWASGGLAAKTLFANPVYNMVAQAFSQGTLGAAGEAGGRLANNDPMDIYEISIEFFAEFTGTPIEVVGIGRQYLSQKAAGTKTTVAEVALDASRGDEGAKDVLRSMGWSEEQLAAATPEFKDQSAELVQAVKDVDNAAQPATPDVIAMPPPPELRSARPTANLAPADVQLGRSQAGRQRGLVPPSQVQILAPQPQAPVPPVTVATQRPAGTAVAPVEPNVIDAEATPVPQEALPPPARALPVPPAERVSPGPAPSPTPAAPAPTPSLAPPAPAPSPSPAPAAPASQQPLAITEAPPQVTDMSKVKGLTPKSAGPTLGRGSIIDTIRKMGGINDTQGWINRAFQGRIKPGVLRKRGVGIDEMAIWLTEEGFPVDNSPDKLLELLQREVAGERTDTQDSNYENALRDFQETIAFEAETIALADEHRIPTEGRQFSDIEKDVAERMDSLKAERDLGGIRSDIVNAGYDPTEYDNLVGGVPQTEEEFNAIQEAIDLHDELLAEREAIQAEANGEFDQVPSQEPGVPAPANRAEDGGSAKSARNINRAFDEFAKGTRFKSSRHRKVAKLAFQLGYEGGDPSGTLHDINLEAYKAGQAARSEGGQSTIPGVEPVTGADRAQAGAERPLKASATQKAPDEGLFDTGARAQTDIEDQIKKEEKAKPRRGKDVKLTAGLDPMDLLRGIRDLIFDPDERGYYTDLWKLMKKSPKSAKNVGMNVVISNDRVLRILAKEFSSPTLTKLANIFHSRAGHEDSTGRTFYERYDWKATPLANEISRLFKPYMKDKPAQVRIRNIINGYDTGATAQERAVAARVKAILKDMIEYRKDAGEDIGEVENYFPRSHDIEAIRADQRGFIREATSLYEELGFDTRDAKAKAEALLEMQLTKGMGLEGEFLEYHSPFAVARTAAQERVFSARADDPNGYGRFLNQDVYENLLAYINGATVRAEFERSFGRPGRVGSPTRRAWTRRHGNRSQLDVMRSAIVDEVKASGKDGAHVMDEINTIMKSNLGTMHADMSRRWRSAISFVHAWTVIRSMPFSLLSSIPEMAMIGMRTGDMRSAFAAYGQTLTEFVRLASGMPLSEAAEMAEALGIMNNAIVDALLVSRVTADVDSRFMQRAMQRFFKATGLHQYTEATRVVALRAGMAFIHRMAKHMAEGGRRGSRAEFYLKELGVQDPQTFANYVRQHNGSPSIQDLLTDTGQAAVYRTAIGRFVNQTIMKPTRATRPAWANDPVGSLFYGLASFTMAFKKNVLDRQTALAQRAWRTKDPMYLASGAIGIPLIVLNTIAVTALRDALTQRDRSKDDDWQYVLEIADRTGATGLWSVLINATFGLRYERDLATSVAGPGLGNILQTAQSFLRLLNKEYAGSNSPNTDTQERQAARYFYRSFIKPLASFYAVGGMRQLPASVVVYGGHTRTVEDWFVDLVAPAIGTATNNEGAGAKNNSRGGSRWSGGGGQFSGGSGQFSGGSSQF